MLRHKTATHACRDTATHPHHDINTPSASLDTALKLVLQALFCFGLNWYCFYPLLVMSVCCRVLCHLFILVQCFLL